MDRKIFTKEEFREIVRQAYLHGQGNGVMMEAGLERDEIQDYTDSAVRKHFPIKPINKLDKKVKI
jgi:hypothetical protein